MAKIVLQAKKPIDEETSIYLCLVVKNLVTRGQEFWSPIYIDASQKWQIDSGNNFWGRVEGDLFTVQARYASDELMQAVGVILRHLEPHILKSRGTPNG